MVARPAMLKRDTTEAGQHPCRSRCSWLGMRKANHCYGQRSDQGQTCKLPSHAILLSGSWYVRPPDGGI